MKSRDQVPVVVAVDRSTGETLSIRVASRAAKDVGPVLVSRLAKDAVLCTDGASVYRIIGRKEKVKVVSTARRDDAGIYHIQNVNSFHSRLKRWVRPFNGVATRYLPNYLGWHRFLDKSESVRAREFLEAAMGRSQR